MTAPRLAARGVRKRFGGVVALDGVSLAAAPGEALAVVGENGAGKSTLMMVIAGVYAPDAGTVELDGRPVTFAGPGDALAGGVVLIHQELNLAENLSVRDNLYLGRERTVGGPLRILTGGTKATGLELLARVGLPADRLNRAVHRLPPGEKQLVEIARALGQTCRVLILDEPTSSLTQKETDRLYEVLDALKTTGVTILYISHRLAEVKRIADRVTVLRDGKNAGELAKADVSHDNLVRLMVGREVTTLYPRTRAGAGDTVLSLADVRYRGGPAAGVSLAVKAGEVLGMAGLVGAGRTELSEAVFGVRRLTGGKLTLDGKPLTVRRPADAIAAGVLLVPEDRRLNGLVLEEGVGDNLSLPNLFSLSSWLGVGRRAEAALHAAMIGRLRVKTPNARQAVGKLSGGNQQKVVYGKWLARTPRVLVLDEPTRGVDVGAKAEIYALIDELAGRGVAVWMISSDMEELLGLSDRVVVMHEGRLAGTLDRTQLSEQAVMRLATGG